MAARFILKGIPEPLYVERVEDTGSHAFSLSNHLIANEKNPEAPLLHYERMSSSFPPVDVDRCRDVALRRTAGPGTHGAGGGARSPM